MTTGREYCVFCKQDHGPLYRCPEKEEFYATEATSPSGLSSGAVSGSTLNEFELVDRLATMLGVAGPESQEERNMSPVYQRRVLREAISALEQAWARQA
jgi:hypothetical protein